MKKNIIIAILLVALVAVAVWGTILNKNIVSYKGAMETSANSEFSSLTSCALDLSNDLEKCMVSSDQAYTIKILGEISALAGRAQGLITGLPLSHIMSGATVTFLSTTEDYAKYLSYRLIDEGGMLTDEEEGVLKSLGASALALYNELISFSEDTLSGEDFKWYTKNSDYFYNSEEGHFIDGFTAIEDTFTDYPAINYDGKYSDHMDSVTAKGITGTEYTSDELMAKLTEILGEDAGKYEITHIGDSDGDIPASTFSVSDGTDEFIISYSKTGGNIISASSNITVDETVLTKEDAQADADAFLNKLGLSGMTCSQYSVVNNIANLCYVFCSDGVKCSSDCVTVQVSMKDGRILGCEASDYYNYHDAERVSTTPAISASDAVDKVSANLEVTDVALALIQTDGLKEVLCYEIKGNANDATYVVYIDATTGSERRIDRIIDGDSGTSIF